MFEYHFSVHSGGINLHNVINEFAQDGWRVHSFQVQSTTTYLLLERLVAGPKGGATTPS